MSRQKVNMHFEREMKLLADPDVGLPDLNGVVDGVTVGPTEQLDLVAVYYDTPDLSLLRSDITLRLELLDAWRPEESQWIGPRFGLS